MTENEGSRQRDNDSLAREQREEHSLRVADRQRDSHAQLSHRCGMHENVIDVHEYQGLDNNWHRVELWMDGDRETASSYQRQNQHWFVCYCWQCAAEKRAMLERQQL